MSHRARSRFSRGGLGLLVCLITATGGIHAWAKPKAFDSSPASAARFVQQFYDWYLPFIRSAPSHRKPFVTPWMKAMRLKPTLFDPAMLKAWEYENKVDMACADGEIGFDVEPFTMSQDPGDFEPYSAGNPTRDGDGYRVPLYTHLYFDPPTPKPAMFAIVAYSRGRWQFTDFMHGQISGFPDTTMMQDLATMKKEKDRCPAK